MGDPHPAGDAEDRCDAERGGQPTIESGSPLGANGVIDQSLDLLKFAAVPIRPRRGPRQMCPPVLRALRVIQGRPFAAGAPSSSDTRV